MKLAGHVGHSLSSSESDIEWRWAQLRSNAEEEDQNESWTLQVEVAQLSWWRLPGFVR